MAIITAQASENDKIDVMNRIEQSECLVLATRGALLLALPPLGCGLPSGSSDGSGDSVMTIHRAEGATAIAGGFTTVSLVSQRGRGFP